MKKIIFLSVLFSVTVSVTAQVTQPTNAVTNSNSYLGTSNNFDVKLKRNNLNSGSIGVSNTSFGDKTFLNSVTGIYNCAFGASALSNLTGGNGNLAFGYKSLNSNLLGSSNFALGPEAMMSNQYGNNNIAIGWGTLKSIINDHDNVLIGNAIMLNATYGTKNTVVGNYSLFNTPHTNYNTIVGYSSYNRVDNIGQYNIGLGTSTGNLNTTGSNNITIGNQTSAISGSRNILLGNDITGQNSINQFNNLLNIGNLIYGSNLIGYSSTDGVTPASAMVGIGTDNPQNKLEIKSDATSASLSGLRFTNLMNNNFNQSSITDKQVLTVDREGDVILVDDVQGIVFNAACGNNFITKSNGLNGLVCSQIFDNSTSVGIGTGSQSNAYFTWTGGVPSGTPLGAFPSSGNYKLIVNGYTRSLAYLATSDKRYKKEINSIHNALESILKVEGKTYLWDKKANEEIEFDDNLHSGFLAQDLEKIFPHLVVTSDTGEKAVNYMELIPYLVESIKDQQNQIEKLTKMIEDKGIANEKNSEEVVSNSKIVSTFPNPSSDILNVEIDVDKLDTNVSLQLCDLNGYVVSTINIQEKGSKISKSFVKGNFPKGIYILNLMCNGKKVDFSKIIFN